MENYIKTFREIESDLGTVLRDEHGLSIKVGNWMDSAVLKIQKDNWTQGGFGEGIFFSIWLGPHDEEKGQVLYNIHALKHRLMEGYKIKSNEFADSFRERLRNENIAWPNISLKYGPQTLMQGWIPLLGESLKTDAKSLIFEFVNIHQIIDEMLDERKLP